MNARPTCSPKSLGFFADQIDKIETTTGLINASLAIAMHSFDDLDCEDVWGKINHISRKIKNRITNSGVGKLDAEVSHFHHVFFVEEGFIAKTNRQASHLLDSFLSTVVELKVGTPELVGLIYTVIARDAGLKTDAVTLDDQFFVRLYDGHGWLLVDLSNRGTIIQDPETDGIVPEQVSHAEWLRRILLRNMSLLQRTHRLKDYAAMEELLSLLHENIPAES